VLGGGAYVVHGSAPVRPSIAECSFVGNAAGYGGGMRAQHVDIMDSEFSGNSAYLANGGGLWASSGCAVLECTFESNTAAAYGGGALGSSSTFENCDFLRNEAGYGGGFGTLSASNQPALVRCRFVENVAAEGGGAVHSPAYQDCEFARNRATIVGGAFSTRNIPASTVLFDGCEISGNTAPVGGGIYVHWGDLIVRNCTLHANAASKSGSGLAVTNPADRTTAIQRSILSFSPAGVPVDVGGAGSLIVSCTNVYGNSDGDWVGSLSGLDGHVTNFSADPLFCRVVEGDLSLSSQSPCLPGQHPEGATCGLVGAYSEGCGPVSVERATWARIKNRYR
jgi:hypothetical protein